MTHYAKRTPWALEPHYSAHVEAMTAEGLHEKSDIAAELAWRDSVLAKHVATGHGVRCATQSGPYPCGCGWKEARGIVGEDSNDDV